MMKSSLLRKAFIGFVKLLLKLGLPLLKKTKILVVAEADNSMPGRQAGIAPDIPVFPEAAAWVEYVRVFSRKLIITGSEGLAKVEATLVKDLLKHALAKRFQAQKASLELKETQKEAKQQAKEEKQRKKAQEKQMKKQAKEMKREEKEAKKQRERMHKESERRVKVEAKQMKEQRRREKKEEKKQKSNAKQIQKANEAEAGVQTVSTPNETPNDGTNTALVELHLVGLTSSRSRTSSPIRKHVPWAFSDAASYSPTSLVQLRESPKHRSVSVLSFVLAIAGAVAAAVSGAFGFVVIPILIGVIIATINAFMADD